MPNIKKSPRLQFLDTGLINYDLKIQADLLALKDFSNAYKGAIIPHMITQEDLSLNTINNPKSHFWVREKAQASAEVISKLLDIEYQTEILNEKIERLADFVYENLNNNSVESKKPLLFYSTTS